MESRTVQNSSEQFRTVQSRVDRHDSNRCVLVWIDLVRSGVERCGLSWWRVGWSGVGQLGVERFELVTVGLG